MGGVLAGAQDHPWRVAAVVDPVGEQSRRALVQWSAMSVKMLAGPCADHTKHGSILKGRDSKQLQRRRGESFEEPGCQHWRR